MARAPRIFTSARRIVLCLPGVDVGPGQRHWNITCKRMQPKFFFLVFQRPLGPGFEFWTRHPTRSWSLFQVLRSKGGSSGFQFRKWSTRPKGPGVRGLKAPFTPLAAGHGIWSGGTGSFIGKAGETSEMPSISCSGDFARLMLLKFSLPARPGSEEVLALNFESGAQGPKGLGYGD